MCDNIADLADPVYISATVCKITITLNETSFDTSRTSSQTLL